MVDRIKNMDRTLLRRTEFGRAAVYLFQFGLLLLLTSRAGAAADLIHGRIHPSGYLSIAPQILILGGLILLILALKRGLRPKAKTSQITCGLLVIAGGVAMGPLMSPRNTLQVTTKPAANASAMRQAVQGDGDEFSEQAIKCKVIRAAQDRVRFVAENSGRDIRAAKKQFQATRDSITAFQAERQEALKNVQDLGATQQAVEKQLSSERAVFGELTPDILGNVIDRIAASNPSEFSKTMHALRRLASGGGGAIEQRIIPPESFADQLNCLLIKLRNMQGQPLTSRRTIAVAHPTDLAIRLRALLQSAWDLDEFHADILILDQIVVPAPMFKQEDRFKIKLELDRILLSFNDGRMRLAIAALNELLSSLVDITNFEARYQALSIYENQAHHEIKAIDDVLRDPPKDPPLSVQEQKRYAKELAKGTTHWCLTRLLSEGESRFNSLGSSVTGRGQSLIDALNQQSQALRAVHDLQQGMADGEAWTIEKRQLLTNALKYVEHAEASSIFLNDALDRFRPAYWEALAVLPAGRDALPESARDRFDTFATSLQAQHPNLCQYMSVRLYDQAVLRLWYRDYASEVNSAYWDHLLEVLQSALSLSEDPRNISIQISHRLEAGGRRAAETSFLRETERNLEAERRQLDTQNCEITRQAEAARCLAPDVSLANMSQLNKREFVALFDSARKVQSLKFKNRPEAQELQKAIAQLGKTAGRLVRGPSGPKVTLALKQAVELREQLAMVSSHFDALANLSCYARIGRGSQRDHIFLDLAEFEAAVIQVQAHLNGFSRRRIRQGFTSDAQSFENQHVLTPLAEIPGSSEQLWFTRDLAKNNLLHPSRDWLDPILALKIANEAFVIATGGVVPLFEVVAGTHLNTIEAVTTNPSPPPATIPVTLDQYASIRIPGDFSKGLGVANFAILGYGGVNNSYEAAHGKLRPGVYRLDPKIFGSLCASVVQDRQLKPERGIIYLLSAGGGTLLKFDNTPLTYADVTNSEWRRDDLSILDGGIFTVVQDDPNICPLDLVDVRPKDHRYVWVGNRMPTGQRVWDGALGVIGVLGAAQIIRGLTLHAKDVNSEARTELIRADENLAYRILAAAYLVGVVTNGKDIVYSIWFKVKSRHGGYIDAKAPKFQRITATDSEGKSVKLRLYENGDLDVERPDGPITYLDRMDGTVVGKERDPHGITRLLKILRLRRKFQAHVDAKDAVIKNLQILTSEHGGYVPRRQGSAPVFFEKSEDGTDQIMIREGLNQATYRLGKPVDTTINCSPQTVRPYYSKSICEGEGHCTEKALRGVIVTSNGQVPTLKDGTQIPNDAVRVYLPSYKERFAGWNALVSEGEMLGLEPTQGDIAIAKLKDDIKAAAAKDPTGGDIDLNGTMRYADSGGRVLFTITDGKNTCDIIDSRKPSKVLHTRLTRCNSNLEVEVGAPSLSGIAKTASLDTTEGQWFRIDEPTGPIPTRTRAFEVEGTHGARLYWDSDAQSWRANVQTASAIFPSEGNYQFEPGNAGIDQALAGLNSPFEWNQEIPGLAPRFEKEFNPAIDSRETRCHSDGSTEIRYYFHQVATHGARAPLVGTFVLLKDKFGTTRAFHVTYSVPGIDYKLTADNSQDRAYWEPIFSLPRTFSAAEWFGGTTPDAIRDHVAQNWKGAPPSLKATYAYDALTGRFFLKITACSSGAPVQTWVFRNAVSLAGDNRIEDALLSAGPVFSPLPVGIPDNLIASLPAFLSNPQSFRKDETGAWEYRETSQTDLLAYRHWLKYGGATVLDKSITFDLIRRKFESEGKRLVPGTDGSTDRVLYGGVKFISYFVPTDLPSTTRMKCPPVEETPALIVLQAPDGGRFTDPQSFKVVDLSPGQIILVQPGASLDEMKTECLRQESPVPILRPVLQSLEGLKKQGIIFWTSPAKDKLPSYFGAGANEVRGWWSKQQVRIDGRCVSQYGFFEVDGRGGSFVDAITHKKVTLDPHSLWSLEASRVGAAKYECFHRGYHYSWSVSAVGWRTLRQAYKEETRGLGVPDKLKHDPYHTFCYKNPGTGKPIVGVLLRPAKADPYAPIALDVTQPGTLQDPLLGMIRVDVGDTLLFQLSKSLQEEIAQAQADAPALRINPDLETDRVARLTDLVGVKPVQNLSLEARMQLPFPDDTLVHLDETGMFDGQVLLLPKMLDWLQAYQKGFGYVVMDRGRFEVKVNGKMRCLSGMVGIGDQPDELPLEWIQRQQCSRVDVSADTCISEQTSQGCTAKRRNLTWRLANDGHEIGTIFYGLRAACVQKVKTLCEARALLREACDGPPYEDEEALFYKPIKDGTDRPDEQTFEHILTQQWVRERRYGCKMLSRTYLAPDKKTPARVTFYRLDNDIEIPLYSTDGTGKILERNTVTGLERLSKRRVLCPPLQ